MELAKEDGIEIQMHTPFSVLRDENDTNAEEQRIDQSDGGIFAHELRAMEQFDEADRNDACQSGADKHPRR